MPYKDPNRGLYQKEIDKLTDKIESLIEFWGGTTHSGPGEMRSDHIQKTKKSIGSTFSDQVHGYETKHRK